MARHYYGTQPFLAWVLNHYFYNRVHYVYLGAPFYPYRQNNPASSDPINLYIAFYRPFKDADRYDHFVRGYRQSLKTGVDVNIQNTTIKTKLFDICDKTTIQFFYPVVYRVDVEAIHIPRLIVSGSGQDVNSKEYLIRDLQENEFDLLFLDFIHEEFTFDFDKLCYDSMSQTEVLDLLEANSQ